MTVNTKPYNQSPSAAEFCQPCAELRPGYKIAFNHNGHLKRWRVLRIQNGLALVTEGWGVHKLVPVESIVAAPYMIEQTGFPWYLRPFYPGNDRPRGSGQTNHTP